MIAYTVNAVKVNRKISLKYFLQLEAQSRYETALLIWHKSLQNIPVENDIVKRYNATVDKYKRKWLVWFNFVETCVWV